MHSLCSRGLQTLSIPDRALVEWLSEPSAERGLHFADVGDSWNFWSYLGLAAPVLFDDLVASVSPAVEPYPAAEFALLQFTSGSSGASRGVWVTNDALRANVTAMRRWLKWTPDLPGIAWLPVHHDMGLI